MYRLIFKFVFLSLSFSIFASSPKSDFDFDVDEFLANIDTPTYTCLTNEKYEKIIALDGATFLTDVQKNEIFVEKTQYDICSGRLNDARDRLLTFVQRSDVDKLTRYYADAIYQLGFIYDSKTDPKGCQFYEQATELAHEKFEDISVTAKIYTIESCSKSQTRSERLQSFFEILKKYAGTERYELLSFIHNALGLVYYNFSQDKLAAEQYKIAYQLMKDNGVAITSVSKLNSYIHTLLKFSEYEEAALALEELKTLSDAIDTPNAKMTYFHLKSRFDLDTGNYASLRETLSKWSLIEETKDSLLHENLYQLFLAEVCLYDEDKTCVSEYFDSFYKQKAHVISYFGHSYTFQNFLIKGYIFLGRKEALSAFDSYIAKEKEKRRKNADTLAWFTLSDLYSEIDVLERQMDRERKLRENISSFILIGLLVIAAVLITIVYRIYKSKMRIDHITGLLTAASSLQEINNLEKPIDGKVHALAIFDIENLRGINPGLAPLQDDNALQIIANVFKTISRQNDVLGMYAANQFILCLTNIEESTASSFLRRLKKGLEASLIDEQIGVDISLKSSLSIYISDSTFEDLTDIIGDMLVSMEIEKKRNISQEEIDPGQV